MTMRFNNGDSCTQHEAIKQLDDFTNSKCVTPGIQITREPSASYESVMSDLSLYACDRKIVIPISGGTDSTVLLFMAVNIDSITEIHTISFDYGQRHVRELECAQIQIEQAKKLNPNVVITNKVIDVKYIRDISPTSSLTNDDIANPNIKDIAGDAQPVTYVPFRNNMFVSIACAYAESVGAHEIWYGTAQADSLAGYWDGSVEWLESINKLISLNRKKKINIVAPLINLSKADIIKKGVDLGVNFKDTLTCYSGKVIADANTPSSSLRLRGFVDAGYRDPISYIQQEALNEIYIAKGCVEINTTSK